MGFLSVQSIVPPGVVLPFAGSAAPDGWLLCQGQAVSRTTYAALFASLGTAYGVGDGSTTFNLPNTQGYFLRGAGTTGIYSATRGISQLDQFQGHAHGYWSVQNGIGAGAGSSGYTVTITATTPTTEAIEKTNGAVRYGSETRPANVGVNHIIKV